jgi:tetratricopeptide (TPR) repeat protein
MKPLVAIATILVFSTAAIAQDDHSHHPAPERLGTVHFDVGCSPAVVPMFDRAIALLHSFAYDDADMAFAAIAERDPKCAMAHWARAMTHYHQLWDVPVGAGLAAGIKEIDQAEAISTANSRDRDLIAALATYFADANQVPAATRATRYSDAMAVVAHDHPNDDEVATFYALSLIATAPPTDRTHARQKRAADILEPIWKRRPDHPGAPHYLIHAYDSAELAQRGLPAARAYAKIAPAAPHALHMPSHIFTRLGLWDDSIASNIAARDAARAHGDVGEALHAMDYLTYAYLQKGDTAEAGREIADLERMAGLSGASFKIGYAGNAMPVRLAVETKDWTTAAHLEPLPASPPQVAAIVWWARTLGKLRADPPASADGDIDQLRACREALRTANDSYWTAQADVLLKSAQAWQLAAAGDGNGAVAVMTAAADEEDGLEKLPLTPGPIVPAREQLGELLLASGKPRDALAAFKSALALAPNRHGALVGKAEAERRISRL